MSNLDHQSIIDNRIKICCELFSSCLSQVNALLKNEFHKSSGSVYHDGDRSRTVDVAKLIFSRSASFADIRDMADNMHTPDVEDLKVSMSNEPASENVLDIDVSGF